MSRLHRIYRDLQERGGEPDPELAKELREFARSQSNAFLSFLRSVPMDQNCVLFEVYEALIEDSAQSGDVLLAELNRLLRKAEADPRNGIIYMQLEAFALLQGPGVLTRGVAEALVRALEAPAPQVRRFAAYLWGDFLEPDESEAEARLHELQRSDSDWRVRINAYNSLRDGAKDHRTSRAPLALSRLDQLRSWAFRMEVHRFAA